MYVCKHWIIIICAKERIIIQHTTYIILTQQFCRKSSHLQERQSEPWLVRRLYSWREIVFVAVAAAAVVVCREVKNSRRLRREQRDRKKKALICSRRVLDGCQEWQN